jgi:hypothetical protein
MTKLVSANIADEVLQSDTAYSDRFVYSNYFVPLAIDIVKDVPMIPFYTKQQILELAVRDVWPVDRLKGMLEELDLKGLWEQNDFDGALQNMREGIAKQEAETAALIAETKALPKSHKARRATLDMIAASKKQIAHERHPSVLDDSRLEALVGLLRPTVGYAFLDRSRIRPAGFAIGEHVYALGLAPNEEVVLEQKVFTKRSETFEDQNEQEQQFDVELSSTYTTELQEGMERQRSHSDAWGLGVSHTGSYQSPIVSDVAYGQFNASHTISATKNIADANSESRSRSTKDGLTASQKIASKYRTQHKTTFKVSREEGFETSSKRTIRNPNRATPITLHYFKVMQRLEMTQERYGARLCWAPAVKNPARAYFAKIMAGRQKIVDDAIARIPLQPQMPQPVAPDPGGAGERVTKRASSALFPADKWGTFGDMSADYDLTIKLPASFSWDGDLAEVKPTLETKRTAAAASLVGMPYMDDDGTQLHVGIHIGSDAWPFGPGISAQVSANFVQDVTVPQKTTSDSAYQAALEDWQSRCKDWEAARDDAMAAAYAAADAFEQAMRQNLSPINEMISQIVGLEFQPEERETVSEVEFWQRAFDWERASFVTYPSWWSNDSMIDPTLDPSAFINASWAKLYLPVRPGMERDSLGWLFAKVGVDRLGASARKAIEAIVKDLETFRKANLGTSDEQPDVSAPCAAVEDKFICIAKWEELMPTDGTHIEVVQSVTTAADPATQAEIDDAAELRQALNESEKRAAQMKDKAITQMTAAADLEVFVSADPGSAPPPG